MQALSVDEDGVNIHHQDVGRGQAVQPMYEKGYSRLKVTVHFRGTGDAALTFACNGEEEHPEVYVCSPLRANGGAELERKDKSRKQLQLVP